MNKMIKRVAKVITRIEGCFEGCQHCTRIAKDAIAAMREPTEEMIQNAMNKHQLIHAEIQSIYELMIDVALKE